MAEGSVEVMIESESDKTSDMDIDENNCNNREGILSDDISSGGKIQEPKLHMLFDSVQEVHDYYKEYARSIGFGVAKRSSKKLNGELKYVTFACHKGGKPNKTSEKIFNQYPVIKSGCNARLIVNLLPTGKWGITTMDARSRAAYEEFGDVVTFDTTYLTNKYDMPFAPFVGVNHHGQSILFGCGLISNEDTSTFVWLFDSWLSCMSKAEQVINKYKEAAKKNSNETSKSKGKKRPKKVKDVDIQQFATFDANNSNIIDLNEPLYEEDGLHMGSTWTQEISLE